MNQLSETLQASMKHMKKVADKRLKSKELNPLCLIEMDICFMEGLLLWLKELGKED